MATLTTLIRYASNVLAIVSLVMLWSVPQYKILWWVILTLFILGWMTAESVRNAVKGGSEKFVVRFWAKVNMVITLACYVLPIIGIVLSLHFTPAKLPPTDNKTLSTLTNKKTLFTLGEAVAYDIGRVYQMGHNCDKGLESVSPPKAAGFFINYFDELEVQLIMNQYEVGMNDQKGKDCDKEELQAFMLALNEKMANYIKLATPYTRPYSQ